LLKTEWWSTITEEIHTSELAQFTDEGTRLPFFLSYWKHQHIMTKNGNDVVMTDAVEFRSSNTLSTLLMYPAIYLMLFYRKPIYKKKL
jgi:ligand-binding SRPBCC domain-containing protein